MLSIHEYGYRCTHNKNHQQQQKQNTLLHVYSNTPAHTPHTDAAVESRAPPTPDSSSFSLVGSSNSLAGGLYTVSLAGVGEGRMMGGGRSLTVFIARVEADGSSYYFPVVWTMRA